MGKKKFTWQLFTPFIFIVLIGMTAIGWYGSLALHRFYIDRTAEDLKTRALLLEDRMAQYAASNRLRELHALCNESGRKTFTRITVVNLQGTVLCDSENDAARMANHTERPEIRTAFSGKTGQSFRLSATNRKEMLYIALPLEKDNQIIGAIRTSVSLASINKTLTTFLIKIATAMLLVILLAVWISAFVLKIVYRPFETIQQGAKLFANGNFSRRIEVSGSDEIERLARTLNKMATEIDNRIKDVVNQKNELEIVVSSMIEGVIAVNLEKKIDYMNAAAAMQLNSSRHDVHEKNILEVVRNIDLLRIIQQTLELDSSVEGTIMLNRGRDDERILQVHGAQLYDAGRRRIGALIVTNDVTKLLQLEDLRRDFVANVSHELKTPITSIKGYVETLLEEAVDSPQHFKDFLGIILKHSNRLQAIVEDLLTLSKIEQGQEHNKIALETGSIKQLAQAAIEICSIKAADKNISIKFQCDNEPRARINAPLLEQALVNLIDNAIKYGRSKDTISVSVESKENKILIRVIDTGPGISPQHMERLFERFYVIDKARSKKLGGTGLGLAIVKHIVIAHAGEVRVESELEKGTAFTVELPYN